jgi:hypothetical protein
MKTIGLLLVGLLFVSVLTSGQQVSASPENFATSGNAFLRVCEPESAKSAMVHMTCMAYVIGVSDGAEMMGEKFRHIPYCPGPDVENGQTYRIVVKYVQGHPERADLQTRILIMDALSAAFPCRVNK